MLGFSLFSRFVLGEAVFARCLSALKEDRVTASKLLPKPTPPPDLIRGKMAFVEHVRKVLFIFCSVV